MSKIWFITGSSRGSGRRFAEAVLSRGDKVAATARNTGSLADLAAAHGDRVLPLSLDVTDKAAVTAAVNKDHERFGRLDVVVNNASCAAFANLPVPGPDCVGPALLNADAANPPLRVFFSTLAHQVIPQVYAERLKTWQEWAGCPPRPRPPRPEHAIRSITRLRRRNVRNQRYRIRNQHPGNQQPLP